MARRDGPYGAEGFVAGDEDCDARGEVEFLSLAGGEFAFAGE